MQVTEAPRSGLAGMQTLVTFGANDGIDGNLLDGYPKIKDLIAKMMALPDVVAWYAKNPPPQ